MAVCWVAKSESASVTVDGFFEILKEKMKNSMQLFAEYPDVGTQVVMSILNEVVSKHAGKR